MADPRHPGKIDQSWLVTFADLMALLLSFFVMLYGMSVMQTEAWKSVVTSLSDELAGHDQSVLKVKEKATPFRTLPPAGVDLDYLHSVMADKFRNDAVLRNVTLTKRPGGLSIAISVALLFEGNTMRKASGASRAIGGVSESLLNVRNRIEVHAYSSAVPASTERPMGVLPSPWELALARAGIVAAEMRTAGIRTDLRPFGHISNALMPAGGRIEFVVREWGEGDE